MLSFDSADVTTLSFDCYGTLIDWETGMIRALGPLLERHGVSLSDDEIITIIQELDSTLCAQTYQPYRMVLEDVVEGFGQRFGFAVRATERKTLVASLPSWKPFNDTIETLSALADRFRLAVVANIDDDLFAITASQLKTPFDLVVTAEQARCYKPKPAIFEVMLHQLGVEPHSVVHVAEDVREIPTARRLGCRTIWVSRHGRSAGLLTEKADIEIPDLRSLRKQESIIR
jgi:2-haloacid dehalogenase